jgi:LysM repeat protein
MPEGFARLIVPASCAALALAWAAPAARGQQELADLHEDVRGLNQRVNDLSLRVEQLEHENAELRAKVASGPSRDAATVEQLNGAVADLNAAIKTAVENSQNLILERVARQMETMARQTNAALDALAKSAPAQVRAAPAPAEKTDTVAPAPARDGLSYTVAKGDSLGLIAKKTGAKMQDIIDANHIVDPSKIQVGQVLVIPGGKTPAP